MTARRILSQAPPAPPPAPNDDILHGAARPGRTLEGDAVFRDLVRYLAQSLQVEVAFIALPLESDPPACACWLTTSTAA